VPDVVAATNFDQSLVSHSPRDGLLPLVRRQLELATEPNAPSLCSLPAFVGSGLDQLSLKSTQQGTQNRQHQPSVRGRGVGPGVSQRPEARASLADRVEHI